MERGDDFFGSNKLYFIDGTNGDCRSYTAYESTYGFGWGLGRCMSRKMIENFGGKVTKRKLIPGRRQCYKWNIPIFRT
jgi:hypothetical protein